MNTIGEKFHNLIIILNVQWTIGKLFGEMSK